MASRTLHQATSKSSLPLQTPNSVSDESERTATASPSPNDTKNDKPGFYMTASKEPTAEPVGGSPKRPAFVQRDAEGLEALERVVSGESTRSRTSRMSRLRSQHHRIPSTGAVVDTHLAEEQEKFDADPTDTPPNESPGSLRDSTGDPECDGQEEDPDLVDWDSPDSQENPRNWSKYHKMSCVCTVASYAFLSPFASSIIAPALDQTAKDLNINSLAEKNMVMSIFVLAYAFGPFFWSPLAEIVGRRPILLSGNLMFIIFNLGSSFAQKTTGVQGKVQMYVLRFLAGFGGSAPLVLGGATVSDLYIASERGMGMALYTAAPVCGPSIGPLLGGWISDKLTGSYKWRVSLWVCSGFGALIAGIGYFILPETYQPRILQVKCDKLKKATGNTRLRTPFSVMDLTNGQRIRRSMIRPYMMFGSEVILIALAVAMLILYGCLYVALSSFETIFRKIYGMSEGIAGLHYLSILIGCVIGGQIGGKSVDIIYRRLTARNGGIKQPEFKLPVFMAGSIMFPLGLVMYGFSAQWHVFWLVPDIGAFIFAFGNFICMLTLQTYAVDCYSIFSASALACLWHVRGLAGFGFPMWSVYAYESPLGYGWTNGLVALVYAIVGLPTPFLFFKYGPWLRERSKYHIAAMKAAIV